MSIFILFHAVLSIIIVSFQLVIIPFSIERNNLFDNEQTCLSFILRPAHAYFAHIGGGALTIQRKSFKILGLCMAYMAFEQMGSLSCLTCCDTRPLVLGLFLSHPKTTMNRYKGSMLTKFQILSIIIILNTLK